MTMRWRLTADMPGVDRAIETPSRLEASRVGQQRSDGQAVHWSRWQSIAFESPGQSAMRFDPHIRMLRLRKIKRQPCKNPS
ncbi:MAG TPA: hypothetical protein VGC19_02130 [Rhodanobacter sp.]